LACTTINQNGFNFNQSIVDSQGRVINTWVDIINCANLGMEVMHAINTWVDIINCANLGMEVMHKRNAHNFSLNLGALGAPYLNG
jgi:photosystem II P680 reaction center D1 protein